MKLDGVIFDMDGTMFDTEPIWQTFWEPALAQFGLPYQEGLAEECRGISGDVQAGIIRRRYGDDVDGMAVHHALFDVARKKFLEMTVPMKPGLTELLAYFDERGIPMAVATGSDTDMAEHHLEANGIRHYFKHVIGGNEVERSKPFPDIFLEGARRLGTDPASTLVLEDSPAGAKSGTSGGFITVIIPDTLQPDPEDVPKLHALLESLYEVPALLEA